MMTTPLLLPFSCDENYRKNHYLWPYMKDCSFITSFPRLTSLCLLRTLALATLSFEDAQGPILQNFFIWPKLTAPVILINIFFKMGQSQRIFVYFCSFLIAISIIQIEKSVDGVLGI